jgi:hypothetical protein
MLAAFSRTVKSPASLTPEQVSVDHALNLFWTTVEQLRAAADRRQPIHDVEEAVFRQLLVMGHSLLRAFVAASGDGDVGPTLALAGQSPSQLPQVLPRLDERRSRPYLSIFGEIPITRTCYGHGRVEAAPLDARLHLPRRQYSYLFQQWLGSFVIDDAHAEAIKKLQTILGLGLSVKASEDLNREQAGDVEPFQNHLATPDPSEEGPILVVTADCKGVPLVRSALPPAEVAESPLPAPANRRRGKGEKANKKKMAAVGAVYTIEPFMRTADDVVDEIQRREAAATRPTPSHKRVRAELLVGKVALFLWLADEVIRRDPGGLKPVVFLSDGERALHDRQDEYLPAGAICILDLYHVLEKLWKAAWCFFDEATEKHEAHQWVEKELRMLLEGRVGYVIGGLRQMRTKRQLKGVRRKAVNEVANYLARNRQRMRYDDYLAKGYPIGSGVVEGACRHLVKDRLERAGMRWRPEGAQAMLDLRATYLNGEWDSFWAYHVEKEDERLYSGLRNTG